MPTDRSKKVGSTTRVIKDGASGKTGNALGPMHMGGAPAGRAQVRGQATSDSGRPRASTKSGEATDLIPTARRVRIYAKQSVAGITHTVAPYFSGVNASAGYAVDSLPAGMTLNTTTGAITGTPTTIDYRLSTFTATGAKAGQTLVLLVDWYIWNTLTQTAPVDGVLAAGTLTRSAPITPVNFATLSGAANVAETAAYQLTNIPLGLTLNTTTGVLTGTPDAGLTVGASGGMLTITGSHPDYSFIHPVTWTIA